MKKTLKIEGMSCAHCSNRVELALNEIPGVKAKVDLEAKIASVTLEQPVEVDVLIKAVTGAGYEVIEVK